MTKEEAYKLFCDYGDMSLGFCPIIHKDCNTGCVCYTRGKMVNHEGDSYWYFVYPFCNLLPFKRIADER